ncbi:MAG: hypothetical protein QM791_02370 [Ferruginibacter sp.]
MKTTTSFFLFLLLFISITSCKKESAAGKEPKTVTELLAYKGWKYTSVKASATTDGTYEEMLSLSPACAKDNIFYFKEDGTYYISDGATKCSSGTPDVIETGTWSFFEGEDEINVSKTGGSTVRWQITLLDKNNFNASYYGASLYWKQSMSH